MISTHSPHSNLEKLFLSGKLGAIITNIEDPWGII